MRFPQPGEKPRFGPCRKCGDTLQARKGVLGVCRACAKEMWEEGGGNFLPHHWPYFEEDFRTPDGRIRIKYRDKIKPPKETSAA